MLAGVFLLVSRTAGLVKRATTDATNQNLPTLLRALFRLTTSDRAVMLAP